RRVPATGRVSKEPRRTVGAIAISTVGLPGRIVNAADRRRYLPQSVNPPPFLRAPRGATLGDDRSRRAWLARRGDLQPRSQVAFRVKWPRPSTGIRSTVERCSLCAANAARLAFPCSSISPNAYWSSIVENKARASDSVIHPPSPTCKVLSDADSVSSSTALSLRAS